MKPFAIYFPQFYSTPTNDNAWGHGFTDWALVANANVHRRWSRRAPLRGFYDGSQPDLHLAQLREMAAAGLGGAAVYHYWFYSHQELPAFEQSLLALPDSQTLPWFLIWATEGWSRRWIGDPTAIVTLSTEPTQDEINKHCDHLQRCFERPGYFRWQGKPLFVWYKIDHFLRPRQVVEAYKETLERRGVPIVTGHFVKNPFDVQYCDLFDINYLFEPRLFYGTTRVGRGAGAKRAFDLLQGLLGESGAARLMVLLDRLQQKGHTYPATQFLDYLASGDRAKFVSAMPGTVQEVISPGWNNTPRYGDRFTAIEDLTPQDFARLVGAACAESKPPPLVNAWNEWSEGAAIEPCAYLGTRYIDVLKEAK